MNRAATASERSAAQIHQTNSVLPNGFEFSNLLQPASNILPDRKSASGLSLAEQESGR
jgi:hypothetical protein